MSFNFILVTGNHDRKLLSDTVPEFMSRTGLQFYTNKIRCSTWAGTRFVSYAPKTIKLVFTAFLLSTRH